MGRPGIDALKRAVRTNVAVIVVEDIDRVSRTLKGVDDFLTFCDREFIQLSTWTGVPTYVGIGPTKTLAKLANKIAIGARPLHAADAGSGGLSDNALQRAEDDARGGGDVAVIGLAAASIIRRVRCHALNAGKHTRPNRSRRYFTTSGHLLSDSGQTVSSGAILRTISK